MMKHLTMPNRGHFSLGEDEFASQVPMGSKSKTFYA